MTATIDFPAARRAYHATQDVGAQSAYAELVTRFMMVKDKKDIRLFVFMLPNMSISRQIGEFMMNNTKEFDMIPLDTEFKIQLPKWNTTAQVENKQYGSIDEYNQSKISTYMTAINTEGKVYNHVNIATHDINIAIEISKHLLSGYSSAVRWYIRPVTINLNGKATVIPLIKNVKN